MELTRGERATSAMLLLLFEENFPPILPQEGHPLFPGPPRGSRNQFLARRN
jgi:hypothetical protein